MIAAFLDLQALIFAGSAALYAHRCEPETIGDAPQAFGIPCAVLVIGAAFLMAARGLA